MTSELHGTTRRSGFTDGDDRVRRILDRVLAHLGMDAVYLTQATTGRQLFRAAGADDDLFGVGALDDCPLDPGVARLVVNGDVPRVIRDVSAASLTNGHGGVLPTPVASFIGVPVPSPAGDLVGSMCCVSARPRPDLDQSDVAFMEVLAEFLAEPLDAWHSRFAAHRAIKRLLRDGAIVSALQPIVRLTDGACVGVEALARFPQSGVTPESAFKGSRDCGLDAELERAALKSALANRPLVPAGAHLFFNVGPAGIMSEGFVDELRAHGPLDGLVLEITEHASVEEYANLASVLNPLRRDGLRLAVDDVGAGYASLRHVLQMAPDILKIDRSLVDGISSDLARRSVVTGIVLLALDLGVLTIAEGVETAADAAALADLGVDMVQGYLFAPPTTDPDEWRKWETPWLLPGTRPKDKRRGAVLPQIGTVAS